MVRRLLLTLVMALAATPAAAQDGVTTLVINGGHRNGVTALNVAVGARNQQANIGVIAVGEHALAVPILVQNGVSTAGLSAHGASATIFDRAFSGSAGWTAVSGAAGNDNRQANIAAIAFGFEAAVVTDLALGQTRASQQPTGASGQTAASPERTVAISDSAFKDSSGLVQVSLIGGERNSSANSFALALAGARP